MIASLLAAIKLGDQIERFGSYAGYAAVIGLGVLAMLYFAQAREVKRLREWAGRAPERDAELAQRVQSDAQRRVVDKPVPAPAAVPQPAGPQTAAAQQADAARKAAAATVMQKFQQPGGASGSPGATEATGAPMIGPPGSLARPGQPLVPGGLGVPAPVAPAASAMAPPAPSPGPPVAPNPATAGAVAAAHQAATAARSPALTNGAGGQDTHESAAARPPLPLDPPRTARAASGAASPEKSRWSRGRIGLIAGGAGAALVVAIVLVVLLTGGSDAPPADNAIGSDSPPAAGSPPPPPPSAPRVDRKATQVAVLNGTTQNGLAGSVANKIEDGGFTILSKGNNSDQQIATTSVSFAEGGEPAARLVAKIVDVPTGAVQPMDSDTKAAVSPEAKVVVIVGNNLGSTG